MHAISSTEEGEVVEAATTAFIGESFSAAGTESVKANYRQMLEECDEFSTNTYEKLSRVTEWKGKYQVILNSRREREGASFSDPPIIGTFFLRIKIELSAQDSAQLSHEHVEQEGRIHLFTNRTVLSNFPNSLRKTLNFGGVIGQVRSSISLSNPMNNDALFVLYSMRVRLVECSREIALWPIIMFPKTLRCSYDLS